MKTIKIKDEKHLIRDVHSKAILNTDRKAMDAYIQKTNAIQKQKEMEEDIKIMKSQLNDIVTLLAKFMEDKK